jgi:D-alanyl-D-alanine carboxypeptidase
MRLKSSILIISSMLLFSGCSNVDSSLKKVPFLSKDQSEQKADVPTDNSNSSLKSIYFNNIKVINGQKVIQNPTNILALVNKNYTLPSTYIPNDLVQPKVALSFKEKGLEKSLLRKEAALALEKMFSDAKDSGIELYDVSGYRSYKRQKNLFDAEVNRVGVSKAEEAVAIPGSSEHQTGLALDICSKSTGLHLIEGFANTKEGKWLEENAHSYGFILRYPKGKEEVTNYEYEPWHYRYVGIQAATIIYKNHWTLEDYFNAMKKI